MARRRGDKRRADGRSILRARQDILLRDTADTADADDDADARIASSASTAGDGLAKLRELMEEQVTRTSTKRVLFSVPLVMGGSRDGKGQIMISVHGWVAGITRAGAR